MQLLFWSIIFSTLISRVTILAAEYNVPSLDGVILTTGKDTRAFEKSIASSLKYLVDINRYFIITPSAAELSGKLGQQLGKRVIFVDESIFGLDWRNVSEVMIESVRQRGVYPLNGKSQFEHTVWGRAGWFLQQLLKFYAGKVLNLNDFVLLDSDIVWFKETKFLHEKKDGYNQYYYASSSQYHAAYIAPLKRITGMDLYHEAIFRSGICHHMVIVKSVLDDLIETSERRYGGIPFWQVLLNESAIELTCRAPRQGICGGGSTLSEYEIYFNYARLKFPETVKLRPLLWANGPMPGLLFWPQEETPGEINSDGPKKNWLGHRQAEVPAVFQRQIAADAAQGFDFIAYHGYAKRRYFELHDVDIEELCRSAPHPNSTCSWKGFEEQQRRIPVAPDGTVRTVPDWFQGCACYMANHQAGP